MPGIFERMGNIIRANINDLLDSAEDPEAMLNQIIRDMSDALRQADSDIADQIAQQKMMQGDLDEAKRNGDAWQSKAELAVGKGVDDLARQALIRVNDYADQVQVYQKQLDAQTRAVNELKIKRDQLQAKYDSAVRNKEMLISRAKRAQAQSRMTKATAKSTNIDYSSELNRMERKIREMEARSDAETEVANAKSTLDQEFDKLSDDKRVDDQLAALKAKMGKDR